MLLSAIIISSCNGPKDPPDDSRMQNKTHVTDSTFGIAMYVFDWKSNDIRVSRSLLYEVDSLLPDKNNPKKNVWKPDSIFIVAMPSLLIDSTTRKPVKDSLGNDKIVWIDRVINKKSVRAFYPNPK